MRTKWLMLALVFSVVVNLVAVGTVGFHWWKVRSAGPPFPPFPGPMLKPLHRPLSLEPGQIKELEAQRRRIGEEIQDIRRDLFQDRARLMQLLRSPDPDSMEVEKVLQEIASSQIALERNIIHSILRMKQVLTPEQREKLLRMLEERGGWDKRMEPGWEHPRDPRLRHGMRGRRDRSPGHSPEAPREEGR